MRGTMSRKKIAPVGKRLALLCELQLLDPPLHGLLRAARAPGAMRAQRQQLAVFVRVGTLVPTLCISAIRAARARPIKVPRHPLKILRDLGTHSFLPAVEIQLIFNGKNDRSQW